MSENVKIPEGIRLADLPEIGKGSTATVYRLDETHVLKVYDRPRYIKRLDFIEREAAISHAVASAGLPAPDTHGIVTIDGLYCAIYDLVKGESLGDVIIRDPESLQTWAARMAQMATHIHSLDATDEVFTPVRMLTKLYPYMEPWLDDASMQRFRDLCEAVPDRDKMVHTDFHFDNVLVYEGKLYLIDAGGMSHGHPVWDLLSMYRRAYFPEETRSKLTKEQNVMFYESFLDVYFAGKMTDDGRKRLDEATAFLTKCIRVAVPTAKGEPASFEEDERRAQKDALSDLLSTDPAKIRALFEELAPCWTGPASVVDYSPVNC